MCIGREALFETKFVPAGNPSWIQLDVTLSEVRKAFETIRPFQGLGCNRCWRQVAQFAAGQAEYHRDTELVPGGVTVAGPQVGEPCRAAHHRGARKGPPDRKSVV